MKNTLKLFLTVLFASLVLFTACEDRSDLTAPGPVKTGTADFSKMVAIGNSLIAGVQSNSLYASAQEYSIPSLFAQQVGASIDYPIISDPGIAGRLEVSDIIYNNGQIANIVISPNPNIGTPQNLTHPSAYSNLGIPGAILYDLIDETDFAAKSAARKNPFFEIVLRNQAFGKSVLQQALAQQPTFVLMWIGHNDVLGYATSGGTRGTDPTGTKPSDAATFAFLYNSVAAALHDTTGARKVAVANLIDITNIPFFNTVGPVVGLAIQQAIANVPGVVGLFYQKSGEAVASSFASPTDLFAGNVMITLTGSSYATLIGQPTGKFYEDNGITPPSGIDITKPFGLHPQNPWPNAFTLDADEQTTVKNAVTAFNNTIKTAATTYDFAFADMNAFFNTIKAKEVETGGYYMDGIKITTQFVSGNAFSLDGVHPTSMGNAIVVNKYLEAINQKFGASLPLIDISTIPGSLILSKEVLAKNIIVNIDIDALINSL